MCKLQTQDLNLLLMHGQFLNIPNFGCLITSVVLSRRFGGYACFGGFVSVFWVLVHVGGTQRRFCPKCIENTFKAIQSTFRSLEMHSQWRYKICICSVILGHRNCYGFSITFPKILDVI